MPSTGRGGGGSPGGGGSSTSSQLPPLSRSPLPRTRPSTCTLPASATSAAAVRDSPKSRDRAWSTRWPSSPAGTGRARWRPEGEGTPPIGPAGGPPRAAPASAARRAAVVGPGPRGLPGPAAGAVELDAADREQGPEDAAADDRRVRDVEHRP